VNVIPWFSYLARVSVVLTLVVIVLGAYVRLSDAGLGCPDWPGCYGRLVAPTQQPHVERANEAFPERPVEVGKAWKEMVHRYAAGLLGLLILGLAILAWRGRHRPGQPVALPFALVGLVIFQSLLGMWTVTLQLKPLIVMAHLLGGLTTLALLWVVVMRTRVSRTAPTPVPAMARPWVVAGLIVLVTQIALGGWTSANYAALSCPDFPTCQRQWWPANMDFGDAFVMWRGTGVDYEFGVLDTPARTAIHMTHRIGALVTAAFLGILSVVLLLTASGALRYAAWATLALLVVQIGLGTSNVLFSLPLAVAVAHNGVAALLLLSVVTLVMAARRAPVAELRARAKGAVDDTAGSARPA
jgi:heme a synthase